MNRIASPNQLTAELQRLLTYSQTEKPSREKLASAMRGLAIRLASDGLRPQDLKRGLVIEQKDHPEYGEWRVQGPAKGVPGMWEIRGARGDMLLDEGELHFWQKPRPKLDAQTKKWAVEAVKVLRFRQSDSVDFRTDQKLYKRLMQLVNKIADRTGNDASNVMDQLDNEARKQGPLTPTPGKDY
jgi:hypothetical protein